MTAPTDFDPIAALEEEMAQMTQAMRRRSLASSTGYGTPVDNTQCVGGKRHRFGTPPGRCWDCGKSGPEVSELKRLFKKAKRDWKKHHHGRITCEQKND